MTYKEAGFRAFYRKFVAVPAKDDLKASIQGFPGSETAEYILTYGYIDRECGLTLEVLASAQKTGKGFCFAGADETIRSFIRIGAVAEEECLCIPDEKGELAGRFAGKLELLHRYDAPEEVEQTRNMDFLDGCRDEQCVDDVLVYLTRDGLNPEGCWVRIDGLGDHRITGILLNEPVQDFGAHEGGQIAFFVCETEDRQVVCCSDMNPGRGDAAGDL